MMLPTHAVHCGCSEHGPCPLHAPPAPPPSDRQVLNTFANAIAVMSAATIPDQFGSHIHAKLARYEIMRALCDKHGIRLLRMAARGAE